MTGKITFTIIKPDAKGKLYTGEILAMIKNEGFKIIAMKMVQLSKKQAEDFYSVHKRKDFFADLVDFMSSGPVVVAILGKNNAVEDFRKLIGATNPVNADEGTVRKKFAASVRENAIHGSDSDENAIIESDYFFSKLERYTN